MYDDDAGTSPTGRGRRPSFRGLPGAVAAGGAAGILGTLLHAQLLVVGGAQLPVGALGALVLASSLFLLSGLWARNVIMSAVAGAVAYGFVALLSTAPRTLILTGSSELAPGTALAGNLWLFGVLVVTLVAVVVGSVVLRPRRGSVPRPAVDRPSGPGDGPA